MLKQTSLLVAGAALCVSAWANKTDTFACTMMKNDTLRKGEITHSVNGNTHSFTMQWDDKPNKVVKNELKPTSSDSRFLSSWATGHDVGIAEWMFDNDKLEIAHVQYNTNKAGKQEGVINCTKK